MMNPRSVWLIAACCLLPSPSVAQDSLPAQLREARASIAAGMIDDAIRLAERYTRDHARDAAGFVVLGDALMKQAPVGRFRAARAYEEAERLAPNSPEPPYRYAQAGLWLGFDDGESMAQRGLERTLALDPLYPGAWDEWLTLFRNGDSRRRLAERLAPHAANPIIRSRLALLAIESERYDDANQLLDSALVADSTNTAWLALRAQSAFEMGDTIGGWFWYHRALAHADRDSTGALWHQAIGIARSWEVRAWEAGVRAPQRRAWLEAFWARRNPNLFAGINHRVAEHFARFRYARSHFPLLHPMISYHRSEIARAMNLDPSDRERAFYQRCEMYEMLAPPRMSMWFVPSPTGDPALGKFENVLLFPPGVSRATDRARTSVEPDPARTGLESSGLLLGTQWESLIPQGVAQSLFAPLNLDLRSVDSVAARVGYNLATGLDDRGVMFLRLGPPDQDYVGANNAIDPSCNSRDVERWRYADYGEVRFSRPSAFSQGQRDVPDWVFRAMNETQFEAVQSALTVDASSEPAPLDFGVWTAQFAHPADRAVTDLVVVSTRGGLAASLVGSLQPATDSQDSTGAVTLGGHPGPYTLLAQARDSARLGRQTLRIELKSYDRLAVSELLLAPAWDAPKPDRAAMLSRVARTLTFTAGSRIRSYAEVYALHRTGDNVRYRVTYELLRTSQPERDIRREDWPGATRFEFLREARADAHGTAIEILDITPEQTPPGKYLLRLRVEDEDTGADAGRATIAFIVR
jgi:tetratricopeptide (TPR) repeat protein